MIIFFIITRILLKLHLFSLSEYVNRPPNCRAQSRRMRVCILSKQHACILYAVQFGAPKRPELFLGSKNVSKSLRSELFVRISIIPATKNILPRIKPFLLAAGKCINPASIKILLQDRRCIYKRPESLNISF